MALTLDLSLAQSNTGFLQSEKPSELLSPCASPVWKVFLYEVQKRAPFPRAIACEKEIADRPPQYGEEFHGHINSGQTAPLLQSDGDYLVRENGRDAECYTLSLRFDGAVNHYKLYFDGKHYVKEKHFDSVEHLVADGLLTMHFDKEAKGYLEMMYREATYEKSPYMTLNRLKRKALSRQSTDADGKKVSTNDNADSENKENEAKDLSASEEVEYQKSHNFKTHTFKGLNWCEYCGNFLWGFTAQGLKCEDCAFSAHHRCAERVPSDCCPDLKNVRGVFGIDLTTLVKAHKTVRPFIVDKCIHEIEKRGLKIEGLYRVSGFAEEIESLKAALDKDGELTELGEREYENINVVAGTLKLYFRLLPIPIITYETSPALITAVKLKTLEEKKSGIKDALTLLPPAHLNTLKFLMEHLSRVTEHQEINKMTAYNLSTVFAPTLMPAAVLSLSAGMTYEISVLEIMLTYHNEVFD